MAGAIDEALIAAYWLKVLFPWSVDVQRFLSASAGGIPEGRACPCETQSRNGACAGSETGHDDAFPFLADTCVGRGWP
ncbi:hypothetical protein AD945_05095 [Gluconobacter albidus]|uniref:Uncharacterized protein n=1 Tax=Gluconobacter albidus TaxID=318683 RepID=A0A149TKY0_9PROT|nr:hypothetical protein AD945_05095 [Gluconobacter albidus]